MKVSGTEMPNQRARRARRMRKGTAAELPTLHSMMFSKKHTPNRILKNQCNAVKHRVRHKAKGNSVKMNEYKW